MRKLGSKVKKIFIVLFIFSIILDFLLIYSQLDKLNIISIPDNELLNALLVFVLVIFYNIGRYFLVIGIYLCVKLGKRKVNREKLSEMDFKNNNYYFRDIVKQYNPLELSYIDNFKIENPKDVIAALLLLEIKGVIKFNKKKEIIEISNSNINLSEAENILLESIAFGKFRLNQGNTLRLEDSIKKSAFEKELLIKDNQSFKFKKISKVIFILFVISFFFNFLTSGYSTNLMDLIISIVVVLLIMIAPYFIIFTLVYKMSYTYYKIRNPYIRSEKGEELNKK